MILLEVKYMNSALPTDHLAARWYSGRDNYAYVQFLKDAISYMSCKSPNQVTEENSTIKRDSQGPSTATSFATYHFHNTGKDTIFPILNLFFCK